MNKSKHLEPIEFKVNTSPIASKALLGILTKMSAQEVVVMCIREILDGMQLNSNDLPFYAAALDVIGNTIKGRFTDSNKKLYDNIISHAKTIIVDAKMLKNQMEHSNEDNDPAQNKSSTKSTQDASQDDTETYEGHPVNPDKFIEALLNGIDNMYIPDDDKEEGDNDE